ncbi:hypothetical protein C8F01DRAFT_302778 [Mycena amicta]|nr:hypothetical protein C8F01DRAFT_302778 [Mycena amicta]
MPSGVPPLASSGVFAVSDSILIDAPREKVWRALLDFGSYKEWNAFVRNQTILTASGVRAEDQTPAAGQTLFISPVHLPPTMGTPGFMGAQSATVIITAMDHENYRAAWETKPSVFMPRWLLFAERWQMLTEVEVEVDGDGGKTRYESIEVFKGPLAYVVRWLQGRNLDLAVTAMAEGLKRRVEEI